jgi:type IV pilus assembly protein PilP
MTRVSSFLFLIALSARAAGAADSAPANPAPKPADHPPAAASAPVPAAPMASKALATPAIPAASNPDETLQNQAVEEPSASVDLLKVRDPFKKPESVVEATTPKSDLESYASQQFILLGVITGPKRMRAMLQAPNGKTYFVKKGDHIGQRQGVIDRIVPNRVIVQEKIVNILGQAENITTEIRMVVSNKLSLGAPDEPRSRESDNRTSQPSAKDIEKGIQER